MAAVLQRSIGARCLGLTAIVVVLSSCGPGATAPLAGECDLPDEIRARTGPSDSLLPVDSVITPRPGGTAGVQVQILRRAFNDLALSVTVNSPGSATAFQGSTVFVHWRDYIRIVPEDPARMNEVLRLVYRTQAGAAAQASSQDYARATAFVGPATFLFDDQRVVHAGIGATRPPTFVADTITTAVVVAGSWQLVEGRVDASAEARQGQSASATATHKFQILSVVDANGLHVPYRMCSGLGWQMQY